MKDKWEALAQRTKGIIQGVLTIGALVSLVTIVWAVDYRYDQRTFAADFKVLQRKIERDDIRAQIKKFQSQIQRKGCQTDSRDECVFLRDQLHFWKVQLTEKVPPQ